MSWISVTNTASLRPHSAREFSLAGNDGQVEIFIVHANQQFYAYKNHCPHTGVNLNWQPDQFFDFEDRFIQCSTHGALFRIEDGYCVRGPCVGASLSAIPLKIDNHEIYVQI